MSRVTKHLPKLCFSACLVAMTAACSSASNELPDQVRLDDPAVIAVDTIDKASRQVNDPSVGRAAGDPAPERAPLIHVLGSIRSVADPSVQFGVNVQPILEDLVTVAPLGCAPSTCPVEGLVPWAASQIEVVNAATGSAASEGSGQLTSYVGDLRDAGIAVVGYGDNIESAVAPLIVGPRGQEVAIHAISLDPNTAGLATAGSAGIAGPDTFDLLRESVIENRNNGRGVVVLIDWGDGDGRSPTEQQIDDVDRLVNAGADAIVGHGSDYLQRFDLVAQTSVAYSLGNASVTTDDPLRADTAIMRLEFDTPGRSCLLPATAGPSGPALDDPTVTSCR